MFFPGKRDIPPKFLKNDMCFLNVLLFNASKVFYES